MADTTLFLQQQMLLATPLARKRRHSRSQHNAVEFREKLNNFLLCSTDGSKQQKYKSNDSFFNENFFVHPLDLRPAGTVLPRPYWLTWPQRGHIKGLGQKGLQSAIDGPI